MSPVEWVIQVTLLLLLGATIPFAIKLERGLAALRRDRPALDASASGFSEATRQAEGTLVRLRAITEGAGKGLGERAKSAEAIRDDLRALVERAEVVADRLEGAVRVTRTVASEPRPMPRDVPLTSAASSGDAMRSQAERDLIQALRIAR